MRKSIFLTIGLCFSLIAVLGALTDPNESSIGDKPALPPEIVAAEADYEARQQAIEKERRSVQLRNLALPPEQLRDKMQAWRQENRAVLEQQLARSTALDALYVQHGVPEPPKASEVIAQRAERTTEEPATTRGWALAYELALLREANAGNPEALRNATREWSRSHSSELAEIDAQVRAKAAQEMTPREQASPAKPGLNELPPDAAEHLREVFALQSQLREILANHPHPAGSGHLYTVQDLEMWRDTIRSAAGDTATALHRLEQEMTEETKRQLAEKYKND